MGNVLDPLFQQIPWAKPLFAWLLLATILLVLLTAPAYFLFLPIARIVRIRLNTLGDWLASEWKTRSENASTAREQALEQYASDHLLVHLITVAKTAWGRAISEAVRNAEQIRHSIESANKTADQLVSVAPSVGDKLKALDTILPDQLPTVGDIKNLQTDIFRFRVARTHFLGGLLFVVALIVVNTGMLSQILGGLISQSITVFGIPLYYFFAALITTAESGLGYAHGVFSEHEFDTAPRISLGAIAMLPLALGIGVVEGFFYSRIHQNRADTVTIPFFNYVVAQTDIYFLWGFILVMALFTMGLVTYRGRIKMLRETSAAHVKRELTRLKLELQQWTTAVRAAIKLAEQAQQQATKQAESPSGTVGGDAIQQLIRDLSNIQAPPWVNNTKVTMGRAELRDLSVRATVWLVLVFLSASIFTLCCTLLISGVPTMLLRGVPTIISAGLAVAIAVAGLLVGNNEIVFEGNSDTKILAPTWSRVVGIGLIVTFELISGLIMLLTQFRSVRALILFNMVISLGLFGSAYQLQPLLALASLTLAALWSMIASLVLLTLRGVCRALETLVMAMEHVFYTLSLPWARLFGRRSLEHEMIESNATLTKP